MTIINNISHTNDDFNDWYDLYCEVDLSTDNNDGASIGSLVNATDLGGTMVYNRDGSFSYGSKLPANLITVILN